MSAAPPEQARQTTRADITSALSRQMRFKEESGYL